MKIIPIKIKKQFQLILKNLNKNFMMRWLQDFSKKVKDLFTSISPEDNQLN